MNAKNKLTALVNVCDALDVAKLALEFVAAKYKPEMETRKYWVARSHGFCAKCLVDDVKCAREVLERIDAILSGRTVEDGADDRG